MTEYKRHKCGRSSENQQNEWMNDTVFLQYDFLEWNQVPMNSDSEFDCSSAVLACHLSGTSQKPSKTT